MHRVQFASSRDICSCDACRQKTQYATGTGGTKTQFRVNAQGHVCCREDDPCAACRRACAEPEDNGGDGGGRHDGGDLDTYRAPDPYDLAGLRVASATPESTFEDGWKAERLRELDAERARRDGGPATNPRPRLTVAELSMYAPPDSYRIALDKMRSEAR